MYNENYAGRFMAALCLLGLSACGGQTQAPLPGTDIVPVAASEKTLAAGQELSFSEIQNSQSYLQSQHGRHQADPTAQSNAELPGSLSSVGRMPYGESELSGPGQKITSAIEQLDPTVVFADSGDITVNVSSVSFSPGPGVLSWAMYQLNYPQDGYPASISLNFDSFTGGAGAQSGYYILVSNYTSGRWMMSSRFTDSGIKQITLPTNVNAVPQNYLSPLSNLHVAVLAYDDVTLELGGFSQDTNTRPQALIVETSNTYIRRTTEEFQFRNESEDSDNGIARISWDYDADDVEDSAAAVVNVLYNVPGIHEIRMTVFDQNGGWDRDSLYVYTYDTDESILPDEFMEALNEADPDPVPPPDIPLPELGYDETFEYFFSDGSQEWWEIPDNIDNIGWKDFVDNDGVNPYNDMRCFMPQFGGYYYDDHTEILPFTDSLKQTVNNWVDLQGIVQTCAALHGVGVVNEGIVLEVDPNDPLAQAVKRLMNEYPDPSDESFAVLQADAADVPIDFQRAMARLINAIRQARPFHEEFLDPANTQIFGLTATPEQAWQLVFDESLGMVLSHDNDGPTLAYAENGLIQQNFDYANLYQGAAILTAALDEFHGFLDDWVYAGPSFTFDTRTSLGNISITGDGDDVIVLPDWEGTNDGWYLLQVDTGGNDDYNCHAGGNASLSNPIAICIDYSGNDEYFALDDPNDVDRNVVPSNDDTHQQGSGRMGYGFLMDIEGDDIYESVRLSQGCSNFGVGILHDVSGNDTYAGEAMCQGASLVGIGVLFDVEGIDNFSSTAYSQGFGSFRGVGIIANHATDNDVYFAETALDSNKPEYESGPQKNNFCQGVSQGKLPSGDATVDPFVGSGGIGLLSDAGGNDSYTVAIFGQGSSVMEGTGILLDLGGDDTYTGGSACGGASVFRAVGILRDYGGSDDYLYAGELNLGASINYSVGWLLDLDGNDLYEANMRAMGLGERNGFGYFVDYTGSDSYELLSAPMRTSLGSAYIGEFDAGNFDLTPTLGLFLDISGADTYTLPENVLDRDGNVLTVGDNAVWVRSKHEALEPDWHDYEYGVGADAIWP
jgi:hypothetical protein